MIGRVLGFFVTHRSQARCVRGVGHAAACEVGAGGGLDLFKHHRLDAQVVGARKVRQVFLGGGAGLHANGLALELLGALDLALDWNHETLAVIVGDHGLVQTQRAVAGQREGGVAREHVDLARLQGGETLLRIERHVLDLAGIAQNSGSNGLAHVHIQTRPIAAGICGRKPGQARVDAADHLATLLDSVQGFAGMGGGQNGQRQAGGGQGFPALFGSQLEHGDSPVKRQWLARTRGPEPGC